MRKTEQEAVEAFIQSSGYPLEFEVARTLREAGFVPKHGRTYQEGDQHREIDILAELADNRLAYPFQLAVECKHSSQPWIVLRGDPERTPMVLPIGVDGTARGTDREVSQAFRAALGWEPPADFGLVQLKSGRDSGKTDRAFDAARQALSAAIGANTLDTNAMVYPIVVVDGSLYRYRDGEGVLKVGRCRLVWRSGPVGSQGTLLDVVERRAFTKEYLLDLRDELVEASQSIMRLPPRKYVF